MSITMSGRGRDGDFSAPPHRSVLEELPHTAMLAFEASLLRMGRNASPELESRGYLQTSYFERAAAIFGLRESPM
jgi:hypothetical protein